MKQQDRAMTIRLPAKLLKAAQHKCIEGDVSLSEVVRDFLAGWVDGTLCVTLPQPTEAKPEPKPKRSKV